MITFVGTPTVTASVVNGRPHAVLAAAVTDTDLTFVSAVVDWGDDTRDVYARTAKPLVMAPTHVYALPGTYVVTVTATNFASPRPQSVTWTGAAAYREPGYQLAQQTTTFTYTGPIMANTVGFPSPVNWSWQFGVDNACLVSSLTLLLMTARGERLMDPNYGTNIRQLVFSLSGPIVSDAVFSDVQTAVDTYEPRAQLTSFEPTISNREININASFQSLINGQPLSVQNLTLPVT